MLKRRKKKPAYRRPALWVIGLLVIVFVVAGWYFLRDIDAPLSPRFNFILISVNGDSREVFSGETLTLHPNDKVKILKISTSVLLDTGLHKITILKLSTDIFFRLGFRLVADDFDVNALRYEEMRLSALLPDQDIFGHFRFRIQVRHRNQDLGYMIWEVGPHPEDWMDKANRTIDKKQRIDVLGSGLKMFPENRELRRRLLDEYKSLGRWDEAIEMLEKMARKKPDKKTLAELLEIYTALKAREGMISVLRRLVKLEPEDMEARLRLAELLEEKGKLGGAIREYEALLKRMHKKDSLPIHERLGYLYTRTGELKRAISSYLAAAALDKRDANIYYNLSYLYEEIGQKKKAEECLKSAVALRSGDLEGRMKLARSLMAKGRPREAERYLSEVLKEKPNSLKALLLMAKVFEKRGKKDKLRGVYKRVLSLDPKNETVIYNLGILEYEDGNLKGCLPYLKEYIKLHPKDAGVREILFDIYMRQKNAKMAFGQAQVLVELRPKELDLYDYIFEYLKNHGDYEKMVLIMKKGVQANPRQIALREYLTVAYLKTGKEDLAIRQMEKIHKLRPKDIGLLLNLARLQEKRDKPKAALKTYKKILDLSPDHEEASEAYLRLRFMGVEGDGK